MNEKEEKNPCLIVTGGNVDGYLLESVLKGKYGYPQNPYIIGVDKGLEALEQLHIEPDLVIGDFDSADDGIRAKYIADPDAFLRNRCIVLNPEKDYTDTHVAVTEAIRRNFSRIVLLGATGTRVDHTMANLELLRICLEAGVQAEILDAHNRIMMIQNGLVLKKKDLYGPYISLIPATECVRDITLKGFRYDVNKLSIKKGETIGISNELREEEGHIAIGDGYLYIMETKD